MPPQGTLKWTKVQCQHLLNLIQQFNNKLGECDTAQLEIAMLGFFAPVLFRQSNVHTKPQNPG